MSTRYYPLFKFGNPQLRIFLPNFWMKLVRHKEPMPPNFVLFQTSLEMTDHDVRNYLEKIYKLPIVQVKTSIKQGKIRRAVGKNPYLVKEDDYKEALVILPRDQKFEFPDVIDIAEGDKENPAAVKRLAKDLKNKEVKSSALFPGIPKWFA